MCHYTMKLDREWKVIRGIPRALAHIRSCVGGTPAMIKNAHAQIDLAWLRRPVVSVRTLCEVEACT